ncbi:hypothetical protein LOK49_LG03G03272 [Camellia lanceoleosa]|uniref:Uncharacterized protein n=1 Tax=Camellia lanceoleosa TaxID=1840588 RepID=A0ACC0I6G7_9ERIC|nr:hypothetical protein LOK49_LG03G03272 [Camellia lanceoleosa]
MAVAAVAAISNTSLLPSPFLGHIPFHLGQSPFGHSVQNLVHTSKRTTTNALFWGPRKAVERPHTDLSLGHFTLTGSGSEGVSASSGKPQKVSVSVVSSISEVPSHDWDACNLDSTGPEKFNPFLSHGFLSSLEESGSTAKETGWIPQHIIAQDEHKNILGVAPLYLKSHSYGEYVFDHSWADAYYSYGARYYPKLQCCVPFTPVTGQRVLLRDTPYKDQVFDILVTAMKNLTDKFQVSSLHVTFPSESEWHRMKEKDFLQRIGMQYHWKNRNYKDFDEFLMDMKQSKRKNIRQERKKISAQNLTMKRLRGYEIKARHWDIFYKFYRNTTDNKWGSAYLTRDFFHDMGSKLGDNVLLVVAEEGDELVAGALNLIGGDTLFGRIWGCLPRVYYPSLHFEACYYQAIEAAIELNLDKVEAGAQGEHKIQRGYMPVTTYSCHYIVNEGFRKILEDFLVRETAQVKHVIKLLHDSGPFKDSAQ